MYSCFTDWNLSAQLYTKRTEHSGNTQLSAGQCVVVQGLAGQCAVVQGLAGHVEVCCGAGRRGVEHTPFIPWRVSGGIISLSAHTTDCFQLGG